MHKGRNLMLKGDLSAAEDVTVDFAVDGTLELPAHRLVVTEDAQVNARVTAATVLVRGQVDGHISAERLELAPSAVVNASVVAAQLTLHDGAQLTGPVNTERAQAAANIARHRQKP